MSKTIRIRWAVLWSGTLWMVSHAVAFQTATVPPAVLHYADMVIYNGKVVTMDDRTTNPVPGRMAQAMAVRDGKILAVGPDPEILPYAGPRTERMDLQGRSVIPGIVDPHTHIHNGAVSFYVQEHPEVLQSIARIFQVQGNSYAELKRAVEIILKENMASTPEGQWAFISLPNGGISGTGIGVKFLQETQMTGKDLDELAPKTPVLLMSHPAYVTNQAGRKAVGEIYRADPELVLPSLDKNGIGDLTEYSRSIMIDTFFHDKIDLLAEIVRNELEKNTVLGITTYSSHITGLRFMDAFMKLVRENRMPLRFAYSHYFGFAGNPDPASFLLRLGDMAGLGTDYFWQTGIGLSNVDSGPPMFCSTMEAPRDVKEREWCRHAPGTSFEEGIYTLIRSRLRLAVGHTYGDKGLDYLFQTVERAMKDDPAITLDYIRSRRFSSDHCGFYPRPDQLPQLRQYNWIISCNGTFINRSSPWLKVYGKQYGKWISPVKSLVAAGVRTVYENEESWIGGTNTISVADTPETYFAPALLLLTRKNNEGELIAPEEAIDRVTLMKMMTTWASEFVLKENVLGTLESGKWADFVVLNKDYFTVPQEEIAHIYPLMTVVGGKIVFLRDSFARETGRSAVGPQLQFRGLPAGDPAAATP